MIMIELLVQFACSFVLQQLDFACIDYRDGGGGRVTSTMDSSSKFTWPEDL